ncbi:hypothetical protein LJC57_09785 [Parabacteroides sp. OttesenSCG-928-G07]|nr:hypothetical protein [Parabacteroides sp. OttesenSCG-928-G07]
MKLKNIIIALSAVVAFSACSKDDDGKKPSFPNGTAKLSASLVAKSDVADANALPGESKINNLTVLAFDADGDFLGADTKGSLNAEGSVNIGDFWVPAGGTKIVFVANAPATVFNSSIQTYADFDVVLALLSNQEQANLTMSTQEIDFEPLAADEEYYIGYSDQVNLGGISKLWLTRLPARLQVGTVSTNFTGYMAPKTVFISEVYFEDMKAKSRFFSKEDWGVVEVNNADGLYKATSAVYRPDVTISNGNSPYADLSMIAYTMENTNLERPTRIKVKATLLPDDITKVFDGVINATGKNPVRIKRNYVYNINFSFSDGSFDTSDPTGQLDLQVSVIPYGKVEDTPEF